jgi:hypothetical protein
MIVKKIAALSTGSLLAATPPVVRVSEIEAFPVRHQTLPLSAS